MLSERSQTPKTIYCVIPFIRHSGKSQTVKTENSSMVARSCAGGRDGGTGQHRRILEVMALFSILNVTVISQLDALVEVHTSVC